VRPLPLPECLENLAFLLGISAPIGPGVVHQCMHVLCKQFGVATVAQQSKTRSIAECAGSININRVDRLRSGVKQQLQLIFGLQLQIQLVNLALYAFPFANVADRGRNQNALSSL
jgi:hypothetical protein